MKKGFRMIGFFIAIISGALMSIQGVFNTQVSKTAGTWTASAFVQFSALLVCLAAWGITERRSFAGLWEVEPKYLLLGGMIGAFITLTVIKSVAALGPAASAMIIVISQLIVSYMIEIFGLFGMDKEPFSWRRAIGMLLAIGGIILFKK